jgi:outer membrane protein TolC
MKALCFALAITASAASFAATNAEVSFSEALDQILSSSTTVAIQKQKLEQAEARHTGEIFGFLPSLTVSVNEATEGDPEEKSKSLSASARVNLFRFGADLAGLQAAKADRNAQKIALSESELRAEAAAVKALVDILVDSQALEIAQHRADDTKKLLDIAEARFRRGVLAREEADQVAIDYSNSLATLRNAESKLNEDFASVSKLAANADLKATKLQRVWPWKNSLSPEEVSKVLSLKGDATQVPAFKLAELSLESARLRTKQAKRSILPSIDFTYSQNQKEALGIRTEGWSSVISLSMPIFEGLSDYTKFRVQRADALIAEYNLQQTMRDTPVRQEIARKNLEIAAETARAREATLTVARRLFKSSLARFQAGRANANALSQDQQRVSQAENLAAEGWAQAHLALTEFLHSQGRSIRNIR